MPLVPKMSSTMGSLFWHATVVFSLPGKKNNEIQHIPSPTLQQTHQLCMCSESDILFPLFCSFGALITIVRWHRSHTHGHYVWCHCWEEQVCKMISTTVVVSSCPVCLARRGVPHTEKRGRAAAREPCLAEALDEGGTWMAWPMTPGSFLWPHVVG